MASRPSLRGLWLGLLVAPMFAGCHAGGVGNLAARPEPNLPRSQLTANEAIQRHNINASRVQALEAKPRITVTSPGVKGSVDGRMALERPRNFKLEMYAPVNKANVADIGSNDDEFWFWTKGDKRDNAVYVCAYDDLEHTPISAAFQPDWVIEAMGLKSISREEASKIASKPGEAYGTIELTSTRRTPSGEILTKRTIIDPSGRIKEHRLYQGDRKTLLAYAVVSDYAEFTDPANPGEPVFLPSRFKLAWMPEQLTLDVTLGSVRLNQALNDEQRQARFSEPKPAGTKRLNLADLVPPGGSTGSRAGIDPNDAAPRTRSSRAVPPAGATNSPDVKLGSPEPFGVEGAMRTDRAPIALSADLTDLTPARATDRVVRPGVPRPGDQ